MLRYDADGLLIEPSPDVGSNDAAGQGSDASLISASSIGSGAVPGNVLPAILLTARRYQDHAALEAADLSPQQWTALFQAMIRIESAYRQDAVSPKGARGLAQLMPATAASLGIDADTPLENLDGGARYLLAQMESFGTVTLALAAYNAGPEAVRKYGGIPPYPETQSYVLRVIAEYERLLQTY